MQLEQAAVAMGRASTSPSKVLKFERLTLVRQLLKQPGVQYSHLCTSARQFLDLPGIGNDCSLASQEGEGSDSDVEEDEPTLTAEVHAFKTLDPDAVTAYACASADVDLVPCADVQAARAAGYPSFAAATKAPQPTTAQCGNGTTGKLYKPTHAGEAG
jgi:hypothetical protein